MPGDTYPRGTASSTGSGAAHGLGREGINSGTASVAACCRPVSLQMAASHVQSTFEMLKSLPGGQAGWLPEQDGEEAAAAANSLLSGRQPRTCWQCTAGEPGPWCEPFQAGCVSWAGPMPTPSSVHTNPGFVWHTVTVGVSEVTVTVTVTHRRRAPPHRCTALRCAVLRCAVLRCRPAGILVCGGGGHCAACQLRL